MEKIAVLFDREEREILHEAENFHKALTHLKYEGKVSRGKNVKAANKAMGILGKTLQRHRRLQEGIIFPYLLAHIPKHESVIRFLRSDHEDIQKSEKRLGRLLRSLSNHSNHGPEDGKIQQIGVYLICLLRHHIELETENIHKAIRKELRKDEKKEVEKRIKKWLNHNGRTRKP